MEEKNKKKSKIALIIIAIITIVALLIIGTIVTVNIQKEKEQKEMAELEEQNKRNVPNVVGMTFQEAKEELAKSELDYVIYPWKVPYNEDTIISQDPPADTRLSKGKQVKISLKANTTNNSNNNNEQNSNLPTYVLKTNGYTVFNMTISDFVKKLNDTSTYNIYPMKESDFNYIAKVPQENGVTLESYLYEQINPANGIKNGKGIVLQVDENGKIAVIRYLSKSGIYTDDILLQRILNVTINESKENSQNIIQKAINNLGKPFPSKELHYGYQYWKANDIPAFELFAM